MSQRAPSQPLHSRTLRRICALFGASSLILAWKHKHNVCSLLRDNNVLSRHTWLGRAKHTHTHMLQVLLKSMCVLRAVSECSHSCGLRKVYFVWYKRHWDTHNHMSLSLHEPLATDIMVKAVVHSCYKLSLGSETLTLPQWEMTKIL